MNNQNRKTIHKIAKKKPTTSNRGFDRIDRIADLMHRSIATLLNTEFKDPRIEFVTVVFVQVSRDLSHAKVYISVLDETKTKETLKILNAATGFFRSHLAQITSLRIIPRIQFILDESILRGNRLLDLIEKNNEQIQNTKNTENSENAENIVNTKNTENSNNTENSENTGNSENNQNSENGEKHET